MKKLCAVCCPTAKDPFFRPSAQAATARSTHGNPVSRARLASPTVASEMPQVLH